MFVKRARGWLKHIDFSILDEICLFASLNLSYFIRFGYFVNQYSSTYLSLILIIMLFNAVYVIAADEYKNVLSRGYWKEMKKVIVHTVILFGFTTIFMFITKVSYDYSRLFIMYWLITYALLLYVSVLISKNIVVKRQTKSSGKGLVIICEYNEASDIISNIKNSLNDYTVIGIVLKDKELVGKAVDGIPVIADYDSIIKYISVNWVDEILVTVELDDQIKNLIQDIEDTGTTIHYVIGWRNSSKIFSTKIGPYYCITRVMNSMSLVNAILKRTLDIVAGIVGCILTGILFLIIAPKIKKESPGPVIYKSTRIGLNGKPFTMYKFRSMYLDADKKKKELLDQNIIKGNLMFKMDFDPRIIGNYIDENGVQHTGIGEKLRRTSLDEFPQFFNVLKGDMSVVGTRPPTPDETAMYEKNHKSRLAIKPGITGLWQVSGRSDIVDFDEVVALDREYINNYSIGLDLKIILMTVGVVLRKKGAK